MKLFQGYNGILTLACKESTTWTSRYRYIALPTDVQSQKWKLEHDEFSKISSFDNIDIQVRDFMKVWKLKNLKDLYAAWQAKLQSSNFSVQILNF